MKRKQLFHDYQRTKVKAKFIQYEIQEFLICWYYLFDLTEIKETFSRLVRKII